MVSALTFQNRLLVQDLIKPVAGKFPLNAVLNQINMDGHLNKFDFFYFFLIYETCKVH